MLPSPSMVQQSTTDGPRETVTRELAQALACERERPSHALEHLAVALAYEPAHERALEVLERVLRRMPLEAEVWKQPHPFFGLVALRGYALVLSGNLPQGLELLCEVVEFRPEVPYLMWLARWDESEVFEKETSGGWDFVGRRLASFANRMPDLEFSPPGVARNIAEIARLFHRRASKEQGALPSSASWAQVVALKRLGHWEEAKRTSEAWYEREHSWLSGAETANVLREAGELDSAVTYYERALSHNPGDVSTLLDLGDTLLDLGRFETAARAFDEVMKSADTGARAWAVASLAFMRDLSLGLAPSALEAAPEGPRARELRRYWGFANDELPPILERTIGIVFNQVEALSRLSRRPHGAIQLSLSTPISKSLAWAFCESVRQIGLVGEVVSSVSDGLAEQDGAVKWSPTQEDLVRQALHDLTQARYNLEAWRARAANAVGEWAFEWRPIAMHLLLNPGIAPVRDVVTWLRKWQLATALVLAVGCRDQVDLGVRDLIESRDWIGCAAVLAMAAVGRVSSDETKHLVQRRLLELCEPSQSPPSRAAHTAALALLFVVGAPVSSRTGLWCRLRQAERDYVRPAFYPL